MIQRKYCLQCSSEIRGRSDKKFCDDQCRTAFNNRFKTAPGVVKEINRRLRQNREILEELVNGSRHQVKIAISKLIQKGYNFNYHTHTIRTKSGAVCECCYEYGYIKVENDQFLVVKRES